MSRPRLIETEKFLGCQDQDSSRLENFLDVETEIGQGRTGQVGTGQVRTGKVVIFIFDLYEIHF